MFYNGLASPRRWSVTRPDTRYAKSGDVHIAYQVSGFGPFDLVFVPGYISNVDAHWDDPGFEHLMRRLGSFARLITFDKRGTGLSDRVSDLPSLEQRMDDVRAVMDAVGSQRAALLGASEGGPMSILFAATYPERTRALVLYGAYAHFYTWVLPPERLEAFIANAEKTWGTGASLAAFAPGMLDNKRFCEWWARYERMGASPSAAVALARMNAEIDVRSVLPVVRAPTLVIHRRDDVRIKPAGGRYLAAHITGAKFVEIPGSDHPIWIGDTDRVVDEIEAFLTGIRPHSEHDRVLATVVAGDMVDTAREAARLGQRRWFDLRQRFREASASEAERHRGNEIASRPDGVLASFDGPARAVRFAVSLREAADRLGIRLRCGVHAGELEMREGEMTGLAALIACRIAAAARDNEILVSSTVRDLVAGSGLRFTEGSTEKVDDVADCPRLFAAEALVAPSTPRLHAAPSSGQADRLSPREREILRHLARGRTNPEIAAALQLSEHTVKRHVANILMKLDLPTRAAAATFAAQHDLI
jgi:pimeloyl-ACP methyl ester carboxylesterase/DNA-binding CsgD family transcriptional regulator/class 3 adenylate cyclase